MRAVIATVCLAVMIVVLMLAPASDATDDGPAEVSLKIVFGADERAAVWDGRLVGAGGEILEVSEAMLDEVADVQLLNFGGALNAFWSSPGTDLRRSFAAAMQ